MQDGYGALVGFELKGGADACRAFIDALHLFHHVANIGDARSLAIHPASTTHQQLSAAEQIAAGVTPGDVRLAVGIEHPEDIIGDLRQALEAAKAATRARKAAYLRAGARYPPPAALSRSIILTSLPVLDFSRFHAGPEARADFVAELRDILHGHGFFYLSGHGVPEDLITRLKSLTRAFFALPEAEKLRSKW